MSSSVGASMRRVTRAAELERRSTADALGFLEYVRRRREVLDCQSQRLEHGHLVIRPPTWLGADRDFADLSDDVIGSDSAFLERSENVARLVERRLATVDIETRHHDG